MANTIQIRRGSGTPTTSNLAQYELAYDHAANKLYIHDPTNSSGQEIVEIGGGTITSVTGMTNNNVLTASGSTTISGESGLTYGSSLLTVSNQVRVLNGSTDIRLNANHGGKAAVGTVGSHDFNFITANTIRATVDSGGNFGIGTEALPLDALE